MKTPLGTEVNIGAGHIVLDGFPALRERGTAPPLLGPCLLWPRSPISATDELLFNFAKMAAVRDLGFVMCFSDHPQRAFGGLYRCAKCGWNRYSSFDNTRFSISRVWL